jgi:hypothetical protein
LTAVPPSYPSYRKISMTSQEKDILDAAAASTGVLSLVAWLPPVASLFTIIWLGIRIWETETIKALTNRRDKE